jgi:hypothetical protein
MTSKDISSEFPFRSRFIEINGSNIHFIEKGTIEKMTDKAAKEMVNKIRTPIDKARSAKDQQEDKLDALYGN